MFARMVSPGAVFTGILEAYCYPSGPTPTTGYCMHGGMPLAGSCRFGGLPPEGAFCKVGGTGTGP